LYEIEIKIDAVNKQNQKVSKKNNIEKIIAPVPVEKPKEQLMIVSKIEQPKIDQPRIEQI
jgi:hypothetical protein